MKIALIAVSDDITAIGTRRLASYMRHKGYNTQIFFMPTVNYASIWERLLPTFGTEYSEETVSHLVEMLKDFDLIGFSSMSNYAGKTKLLINSLRNRLPKCIYLWGGIHPTVFPDDAIESADIICRGEGEFALLELVEALEEGSDLNTIRNMWIKTKKGIIKNPIRHLLTDAELDRLPYFDYGVKDNFILCGTRIKPLKVDHYIQYFGTYYNTIYTVGCPFRCSYCSNDIFIRLDPDYRLIRKPSVDHIIGEINAVLSRYPYIRSIVFAEDAFFFLNLEIIQEFSSRYKNEIGLPFSILGGNPNSITEDKMGLLVDAGMIRMRVGIQSGSIRTLKLFNRKTHPDCIVNASKIISKYKTKIIPTAYDIIIDNPYENVDDMLQTIHLLDRLSPPFTLTIFSLQFLPGTQLAEKAYKDGVTNFDKESRRHYGLTKFTYINLIIYAFSVCKIPGNFLKILLNNKRIYSDKEYPIIGRLIRCLTYLRRGIHHLMHDDFTLIPGKLSFYVSKVFDLFSRRKSKKTPDKAI